MCVCVYIYISMCCILTLDQAVNQKCTWRGSKWALWKKYRQVPAAVELVGHRKARMRASLQTKGCGPQWPPVGQPQPRCGRSAAMVKRRSWVNLAVCPCLHSSLTHHRNIENKVWEIHIFMKKCVHSFIEVRKSMLWLWLYNIYNLVPKASWCQPGVVSNPSLNLDDQRNGQ